MKKNALLTVTIITTLFISLLILGNAFGGEYRKATTDSGFDSSSSSSDSSGFSDHSISHSSGSSNSNSGISLYSYEGLMILIITIVIIIVVFIVIPYFSLSKFFKSIVPDEEEINRLLIKYNLNKDEIIKGAYDIYEKVQIAWMNDTLDDVSNLLSDDILNMYKTQLDILRIKNEQNIMSDINYKTGNIIKIKENDKSLEIDVILIVSCKDYIINKETKEVLKGDKEKLNGYKYSLSFLINQEKIDKCPECGAEINNGGNCEYCGTKITRKNKGMIMTKKRMISKWYE